MIYALGYVNEAQCVLTGFVLLDAHLKWCEDTERPTQVYLG